MTDRNLEDLSNGMINLLIHDSNNIIISNGNNDNNDNNDNNMTYKKVKNGHRD